MSVELWVLTSLGSSTDDTHGYGKIRSRREGVFKEEFSCFPKLRFQGFGSVLAPR